MSRSEAKRLWIALARSGGRKREPLDDVIQAEQPKVLSQSFELMLGEGLLTRRQVCWDLSFPERDLEALAGLPCGYLNEPPSDQAVVRLRDKGHPEDSAEIIEFPTTEDTKETP